MERFYLNSSVTNPESGVTVQTRTLDDQDSRPIPGETSMHEAIHVAAEEEIIYATNKPSGNALGTTMPKNLTVGGAAAPEALGYRGTSHDMHIAVNVLNTPWSVAISLGSRAVSGKAPFIQELATVMEEKGTIYQKDVDKAKVNVNKRQRGIHPVEVIITMPNGQANTRETQSFRGEVRIHDLLLNTSNQS